MSTSKKALMIGAGGMAGVWIRNFLPRFRERLEIVGLVDVNETVLNSSGEILGLPPAKRFTDMASAFDEVDADCCIVVVPPAFHKEAVLRAVQRGMDILSEKPIADTWASTCEIYREVKRSGLKMAVIQNYRYSPRILTVKRLLSEGSLGRINYIVARFAADYRERHSWGKFRHEIPHTLVVEGSIHHFDQLRNLSGSDCSVISGMDWNPGSSSFDGECCALYFVEMQNGVRSIYEGSCLAAGAQNGWHGEYYRVECEHGVVSVGADQRVRVERHKGRGLLSIDEVPMEAPSIEGHQSIIEAFVDWIEGGDPPETTLDDNIKSAAMLFGAIGATTTRSVVNVADMVTSVTEAV